MAQLVVAAAGAAIGYATFGLGTVALGMSGAQLGWMAGSLIGSAFAPTQKSSGPQLSDLSVGTSAYGTPIPYVQGHPRISGQIVWASTKREIATTTEQGKGGGGAEYTSYTYEVDLLILLTDNEIEAVPRVWSNGELIYTKLSTADAGSIAASSSATQWARLTVYTGASGQLPDPDYEAAVGVANAPAYRGRGAVFIKSLQLGGSGQIPNLTFEVATSAVQQFGLDLLATANSSSSPIKVVVRDGYAYVLFFTSSQLKIFDISSPDNITQVGVVSTIGFPSSLWLDGNFAYIGSTSTRFFELINIAEPSSPVSHARKSTSLYSQAITADASYAYVGFYSTTFRVYSLSAIGTTAGAVGSTTCMSNPLDAAINGSNVFLVGSASNSLQIISIANPTAPATSSTTALSGTGYQIQIIDSVAYIAVGGVGLQAWNVSNTASPVLIGTYSASVSTFSFSIYGTQAYLNIGGQLHIVDISDPAAMSLVSQVSFTSTPSSFHVSNLGLLAVFNNLNKIDNYALTDSATPLNASVSSVVDGILRRSGLVSNNYDISALAAITRPVRSMAISSVSSARTVLDMLAASYHFEAVLSDKIYFRPRASAPAATLTFNELGVVVDSGSTPDPLPLTQANELEIPAQMALTYSNVDGDYQTDTQYSDRLLTGQESTSAMQVPLGFTSSEAKQIVDAMLLDKAVSALTTSVSLGVTRAALEPTDVVLLTGEDGSTYRMRIAKKSEASGVTTLECVQDDSTVFTQTGTTAGGTASQTVVLATPTTTLELLDVPLLRDVDNLPGHYVAVKGSAANWTSAGLYDSLDDLTYTPNTTISSQAVMGTCTTTLADWAGGNVFDEVSSVTVNVGTQQLVSVTRDDILASQSTNAALIGSEVLQYRTATLMSAGVYTLSGFLRGQRGTDSTGHGASDRFIVLASGGLRFVPLQQGDLGRLRYYKAASAGQRLSAVTSQSLTPAGITLKPFAPVDARANRDTADTVLTWIRQTRLSTRIVGTLGISSPLGEAAEAYEVEIYTAGHAALLRTLTSATPSVTYTSAQQLTDFGSGQSVIAVKIYQISATVGRGTPLITTV